VDESAKYALSQELARGFVTINKWLTQRSLPRLPLPSVCGYSPLMGYLYDSLMERQGGGAAAFTSKEFSSEL